MKNKPFILIIYFLILLLLAACQQEEPAATTPPEPAEPTETAVPPTEEPTAESTEAISEVEAEAELLDLGALTAHPWQWVSFTNPVEQYDVETPEAYLLQFNTDETVNIVADCNNASGSYTFDGSSLTIMVGPMTMAACPEESRSDQFVALLGGAAIAFFEDGNLYIDLMADGGTMVLAPADAEAMVDDGEGAMAGTMTSFELLDECFVDMPADIDYECGNVTVPEFHDADNGRTMTLGVVRLLSPAEAPAEPIFFGAGGPGGSLLNTAATTAESIIEDESSVYAQLLQDRDLVFFSQRGTAYTEPALTCGNDIFEAFDEVLAAGGTADERQEKLIETYKSCYDELKEAGIDLTAYTSVQNAADVNTIRETLGYDQIIYYGESYGTLLGQHVMRDFPETLTAVILDGTVPISAPTWQTDIDAKYQQSLTNLLDLCAADEACNTAYPSLTDDIEAVYQQLGTDPVDVNFFDVFTVPVEPSMLSAAIYDALYSPILAALVPLTVESLLSGTPDPQINRVLQPAIAPSQAVNFFMHYAVVCSEDPPTSVEDAFSLDETAFSIIPEFIEDDTEEYLQLCAYLDLPVLPEETDAVVASDVPLLRLSGALDPITPAFASDDMMASLPNSFSFNFPYGGHVQFLSGNPCAQDMVKAFIDDPNTEPDGSCIADTLPLQFVLPAGSDAVNDLSMLTSEFWLWTSFTSPEESFDVEMPENYLIFFNEAGAVNIGADCNSASGSYTFDGSSMTIELGPMTLAACEEGSRSEQFVDLLGSAAVAFFEDGNLYIDLMADGNTMVFTPEE